jgi:hypothetical protein
LTPHTPGITESNPSLSANKKNQCSGRAFFYLRSVQSLLYKTNAIKNERAAGPALIFAFDVPRQGSLTFDSSQSGITEVFPFFSAGNIIQRSSKPANRWLAGFFNFTIAPFRSKNQ